jgi:hypothetical protein
MADLSSAACSIAGAFPFVSDLPVVWPPVSVEDYAPRAEAVGCDPAPKPGVVAFRAFVLGHLGGSDLGICRECGAGRSEHYEGRAWDWGVRVDRPADVERVDKLMAWLLGPGEHGQAHANFRRAGLRYMIWDGRIWSGGTQQWRPYSGRSAHRDHVHFTFGHAGAQAQTSFYDWLRDPLGPPPPPGAPPWQAAVVLLGGGALGWALSAAVRR